MNLNIKNTLLIFCLMSVWISFSQNEDIKTEINEKITDSLEKDDHYGIFKIGPYFPLVVGNNFANKGLKVGAGVEFSLVVNLFDSPVIVGLNYNYFHADVTNQQLVGAYTESNVQSFGPVLGYHILLEKRLRFTAVLGVGYVGYKNNSSNFNFSDKGTAVWVSPTIAYQFNKPLGIYFSTSYRRDFLKVEAPTSLNGLFDSASYFTISAGLRLVI